MLLLMQHVGHVHGKVNEEVDAHTCLTLDICKERYKNAAALPRPLLFMLAVVNHHCLVAILLIEPTEGPAHPPWVSLSLHCRFDLTSFYSWSSPTSSSFGRLFFLGDWLYCSGGPFRFAVRPRGGSCLVVFSLRCLQGRGLFGDSLFPAIVNKYRPTARRKDQASSDTPVCLS